MSYTKKSDFGVIYTDEELPRSPSNVSEGSQASARGRQIRSTSISVATEPTSSGLSFVLDMDKEEKLDHSYSLHEDIEKMFEKTEMTLNELLSSGADCVPSSRGQETEAPIPTSDRFSTDYDISSHRRSSFPHIHVPLKSLHSHSLKNFAVLIDEEETKKEKKKKKKKKSGGSKPKRQKKPKTVIYPSRSALLSPSIPEVEKEEYSGYSSEESVDTSSTSEEEDLDDKLPREDYEDDDDDDDDEELDESTKLLIEIDDDEDHGDRVDGGEKVELFIAEDHEKPVKKKPEVKGENSHLTLPWVLGSESEKSDSSFKKPGLFYIGDITEPSGEQTTVVIPGSDLHEKVPISEPPSGSVSLASSSANFPHLTDSSPVVVVLDDSSKPMISTSIGQATKHTAVHVLDTRHEENNQVKFLLGEGEESEHDLQHKAEFHNPSDDDSDADSESHHSSKYSRSESESQIRSDDDEHGPWQLTSETKVTQPSTHKHKHKHRKHHHHENYGSQDLMRRRQRGSEVQISDALKRVPTETEEANMLQSADLDDMASHRMDNLEGFHKHKIGKSRKKHKTTAKMVYEGKSDKPRRKYFKPTHKTFDHSPHEVFVELDELYTMDNYEVEWREKARWIKFEEDVEEGAERWGKPHVASLSFHSLLELRKGLENGSLMLDLEVSDLIGLAHRVVEDMVIHDQIPSEVKGQVMRTLLTKHKFLSADTVKSLIRRNKSSVDLLNLEQRHKREQQSLMKTFSQASFNASSTNLTTLPQNTVTRNSIHQSNNSINHSHHGQYGRSLSVPFEGNHATKITINEDEPIKEKKSKKKKKNDSVGDPGKLEFVKVDVDNNTATQDGVHIGLIPKESEDNKDVKSDQKMSLMRRIPHDAEACSVLVGCVDYLDKPAMAFIRLAEKQVLDNLTEVPLPVRFIFILLGPEEASMDYHEVGRSISTLMSNQHFHDITYKAESRSEILHAINEFLNESIVLPPGDWDQKTLLPIMDMSRKRAKLRRKKQKKLEELEQLKQREKIHKIPMDPLKRTGRPFGGLINDIRRRYPHYISDFKDAINPQCVMALIFIFFACLCPCIAFGGLYGEKTYGKIGLVETIMATSVTNLIFGIFSGQPLILYGATGPTLVFEKHLFAFCKSSHIDFLTWRVWIGLWVFIITMVVLALEGSFIVKYITRFVEEVFAILISLIFINEVVQKLIEVYTEHPLREKHFYCDSLHIDDDDDSIENVTKAIANISAVTIGPIAQTLIRTTLSSSSEESVDDEEHIHDLSTKLDDSHGKGHYSERTNEPNTALLSTILIFGTFLIAYFLRIFRNSRFLGRSARRALGDFGIFTAIVCMVLFDYICGDTYTQKLYIPSTFSHSDGTISNWFVNPLGEKEPMQIWLMFVAAIPAFLLFLLLFLESQLTQMLLHKDEFKLKKGSGFHLDQFILGLTSFLCPLFGLPFMCPATVRSVAHVSALAVMSRTHAPGEKPKLLEVKDQRVTNIIMNILIGSSLAWGSVLRAVPIAVLFGVFLYLGVSAISGVQLYKRFKLLFMPVKHHPGKSYVRRVRTIKMHAFTVLQIVLVLLLWVVKSTVVAIAFPLFVFLMVPLRLKIMPRFFTHDELEVLDKEEEDSEDEDDEDPDFYQMAHMPI